MRIILEMPEDAEAALAFPAQAAQMPAELYPAKMRERAVANRRHMAAAQLRRHLDVMADSVAPDTTPEQMEAAFADALGDVRPHRAQ